MDSASGSMIASELPSSSEPPRDSGVRGRNGAICGTYFTIDSKAVKAMCTSRYSPEVNASTSMRPVRAALR